jgi:hypothetical protein
VGSIDTENPLLSRAVQHYLLWWVSRSTERTLYRHRLAPPAPLPPAVVTRSIPPSQSRLPESSPTG